MRATEPFENFAPWNDSLELNRQVYNISSFFPEEEKSGMVAKMRNCSIDISVCISRFISIKHILDIETSVIRSSNKIFELEALLRIALSLNYINQKDLENMLELTEMIKQHFTFMLRRIEREKEEQD